MEELFIYMIIWQAAVGGGRKKKAELGVTADDRR